MQPVESNPEDVKPVKPSSVDMEVGVLKTIPVVLCAAKCACTVEVLGCLELPVESSEVVKPVKPTPESKDAPKDFPEFWCSLCGRTDDSSEVVKPDKPTPESKDAPKDCPEFLVFPVWSHRRITRFPK